jgi:energy-coupling factor transporter ATP-binding protein EcfA2
MSPRAGKLSSIYNDILTRSVEKQPRLVEVESSNSITPSTRRFVAWLPNGGVYKPATQTVPQIPSGVYKVVAGPEGWYLEPTVFHTDELLYLPGLPIDFILNQIETFWQKADVFKQIGLLHKRGILLYGAAGCGKTSIIKLLCVHLIKRNGVILMVRDIPLAAMALFALRQIEPERPVLTILEDIDVYMDDEGSKSELLSFLDGETQVDHIVHIATTNYPDKLDETIVKRPGRFDVVIELKQPIRDAREAYLKSLLNGNISPEQLQYLVDATSGLGLAHLRELVSATHCLGLDVDETIKRLKGNVRLKPRAPKVGDDDTGFSIGFHRE